MNNKEMAKEILHKLKQGEFCQQECYGCCGDGQRDITCNTIRDNLEKELLKIEEEAYKKMATKFTGRMIKLMYETGDFALYHKVKEAAKEFGVEVE